MYQIKNVLPLFGLAIMACANPGQDADDQLATRTMALTAAVADGFDVDRVQYSITRVPCMAGDTFDAFSYAAEVPLLASHLGDFDPGVVAGVPGSSDHMFADLYQVLESGCYDVAVTPLEADGMASDVCRSAYVNGVSVQDDLTTEVLLLMQCDGAETGGLDTIAAFNRAPTLLGLTYSPSKFVDGCEEVTVCATATDPDLDPIVFEWADVSGSGITMTPQPTELNGVEGTQCVTLTTGGAQAHDLSVTVYDTIGLGAERIEGWLAAQGYPSDSHDTLAFPLYVSGEGCDAPVEDPTAVMCPAGQSFSDPAIMAGQLVQDFEGDGLPAQAPFILDDLEYSAYGSLSTGWCIPGMDTNSPGCGGTNTYLTGDGTSTLTPTNPAQAIAFRWGTQGSLFNIVVRLTDGTEHEFALTDPAPSGWGATGYFGFCAPGADALIDLITITSPDRGIDDVSCVGCGG